MDKFIFANYKTPQGDQLKQANATYPRKFLSVLAVILGLASFSLPGTANAAIVSRSILKTFFETGDKPTAPQFATLIDSMVNSSSGSLDLSFDFGATLEDHAVSFNGAGIFAQSSDGNLINFQSGREIGPASLETKLVAGGLLGPTSLWAGQTGFLGLQFELINEGIVSTHYGFLKMKIAPLHDGLEGSRSQPYSIYVDSFAYETTPGTPITTFSAVPVPGSAWLLGSGLLGLIGFSRKR